MPSWLAEVVRSEGSRISFDRFMELALYHPTRGYYTRHVSTVGTAGDFSTAMTIGDALIRSVANWVKTEAKFLVTMPTQVIELGGGTGRLASGILRAFRPWQRIRYQIVEISRGLRQVQQKELRGKAVRWTDSVETALDTANGEAILISNEFVDAFPCKRFERVPEGWREIFLGLNGDFWQEELSERTTPLASSAFAVKCATGQRIETFLSYQSWLASVSQHLHRGALLTIDYGGSPDEIYHAKPCGTMRAYFRHQRMEGMAVYLRPGRQDLTADVNFVDLREWGNRLGMETVQFTTQADFINQWNSTRARARKPADEFMTDESGMGSAFKVLHQRKTSGAFSSGARPKRS